VYSHGSRFPRGSQLCIIKNYGNPANPVSCSKYYLTLLADGEAPAVFPYGGFGSLLVAAGERSRDGPMFFANLAFSPNEGPEEFT
jgi:hypothetical protein